MMVGDNHHLQLSCMMDDWDLQAVVRGNLFNDPPNLFASLGDDIHDRVGFFSSPSFAAPYGDQPSTLTDHNTFHGQQLEGLYKPFYPLLHQTLSPQSVLSASSSAASPMSFPKEDHRHGVAKRAQSKPSPESATSASKLKKRKNLQKKVVERVTEEGLSSDKWAWRKYGQKPIKGSPYPRSYYRCSSLKGCLARKQVERCSSDPSIFIVTYTAEHSHAHPTRRNSLAGSTRGTRSSSTTKESSSPAPSTVSPTNSSSMAASQEEDDHHHHHVCIKTEEGEEEEEQVIMEDGESSISNEIAMSDLKFSDELFPSLDDLEGLFSDQFPDNDPYSIIELINNYK